MPSADESKERSTEGLFNAPIAPVQTGTNGMFPRDEAGKRAKRKNGLGVGIRTFDSYVPNQRALGQFTAPTRSLGLRRANSATVQGGPLIMQITARSTWKKTPTRDINT